MPSLSVRSNNYLPLFFYVSTEAVDETTLNQQRKHLIIKCKRPDLKNLTNLKALFNAIRPGTSCVVRHICNVINILVAS
jgi:hypothetical protein